MNRLNQTKLKQALEALYDWQYSGSTSFTSMLFDLFMKADIRNKRNLGIVYPYEYFVWREWYMSDNPDQFFRDRGYTVI
jgi:hypothetical protein